MKKKLQLLKISALVLSCCSATFTNAQQGLKAWGGNSKGQLGTGTTVNQNTPTLIGGASWITLKAGSMYSMGLQADSSLWTWGYNSAGQLGDGTLIDKNAPIQIGNARWKVISASSMASTSAGIKNDGTLWAWGTGFTSSLSQVETENNWKQISVGSLDALALKNDGTMWYWSNFKSNTSTPTQIGTDIWTVISSNGTNRFAIKNDGSLWAWGTNSFGELGLGTGAPSNVTTPTQVGTDNNWQYIESGENHAVALKTDGSLWAWGYDGAAGGILGLGVNGDKNIPTQIGTATNWKFITSGYSASYAIKTDNTLWAWGTGCFGHGPTYVKLASPTQIGTLNDWTFVNAGTDHALALGGGASVGVAKNGNNNNQLSLFPNPVRSNLSVTINNIDGATNISVKNILGNVLHFETTTKKTTVINVENFSKGIYFIEIDNKHNHAIEKIIVD